MSKIMVVDDEAYISTQLEERLTSMDYEVVGTASSGEDSISMAKSLSPDLVLMDIVMPGKLDGIEASEIITKELDIPVIFLTAYADDKFLERAKKAQPFGYILKPFQEKEIKANIELALYKKDKERLLLQSSRQMIDKFESIDYGFLSIDNELVITYFNKAAERLLGRKTEEVLGRKLFMAFPEARGTIFEEKYIQAVNEKISNFFEAYLDIAPNGNWFEFRLYPQENGISVDFHLITDRKLAEEKLTRAEEATKYADTVLKQIFNSASSGISLIDKNFNVLKLNQSLLRLSGISVNETKGKKCYEAFSCGLCNTPRCILIRILGGEEKIEIEVEMKRLDGSLIPCILSATPFRGYDGNLIGMVMNLTDITMRKKYENELKDTLKELRKVLRGTIQAMALTVETRDPYTAGHQRRVADLARSIAKEMGFSRNKIAGIRMAGVIHDIGKIAIPSEILSKPGPLSKAEFELIKNHPQAGYDILKPIKFPWPVAQIVLQHHERMDGSGYPRGLSGEEILMEARILGVADVVEAMASHRPYRATLGIDKALEEISINKGKLYDVEVVDACLKLFKENGFKFKI